MASYFGPNPTFAQWLLEYSRESMGHGVHTQPDSDQTHAVQDLLHKQDRLRFLDLNSHFERVGIAEAPRLLLDHGQRVWTDIEAFESDCNVLIIGARDPDSKRRGGFHMPPYGWVRTT